MEYVHLGRSGLRVSRLCVGAGCYGYVSGKLFGNLGMTQERSVQIMDMALDNGINFFDTADAYGWDQGVGLSETIIGGWFAQDRCRRDKVVLATKMYFAMNLDPWTETWPNQMGLSALHIKKACEGSLRRLGTDYIDLYLMHYIDRSTPWEEIWQAMEQLQREGKVLYFGSSNFAGWDIARANERAQNRNFLGLVTEQCSYSLLQRNAELEVIPACEAYGLGIVPYEPLSEGVLANPFRSDTEGYRSLPWVQKRVEVHRAALQEYVQLCADLGEPPAAVALAWLLSKPYVTAPTIGWRKVEHLQQSLRAVELKLSAETLARLEALFPGPGPAPRGLYRQD